MFQVSDLSRCAELFQTSRVLISGWISILCRWGGEWTPVTSSCQWSTEEKGRVCKDYHDTRYSWSFQQKNKGCVFYDDNFIYYITGSLGALQIPTSWWWPFRPALGGLFGRIRYHQVAQIIVVFPGDTLLLFLFTVATTSAPANPCCPLVHVEVGTYLSNHLRMLINTHPNWLGEHESVLSGYNQKAQIHA